VDLEIGQEFTVTDPDSGVVLTAVVIDPAAPPDIEDPAGAGLAVGDRFTVTDSTGEVLTAVVLA
jgi:uncharacterized protein YxjI